MPDEIERAYRRVNKLRILVSKERQRAESNPLDARNVELKLTDPDLPLKEARKQIISSLNELELMLEHLHVAHVAASFEAAAKPRIGTRIGEARSFIEKARRPKEVWPTRLLRSLKSFEGLYDIVQLLNLTAPSMNNFENIRSVRNDFDHGVKINGSPSVDADTTRSLCIAMLQALE